jgi:HEAT repeat protein
MWKSIVTLTLLLTLAAAGPSFGQTGPPAAKADPAKLITVLKSDAPLKDKADACRQLALVGTPDAVPVLAALLGDDKLAHMARYALEPIPDPSVDAALREALGKLKGKLLVGVIGSIGVRRDAKAVPPLTGLLKDADAEVVRAAARTLGRIGSADAARALEGALAGAPAANQLALYEGLFRCAEALAAGKQLDEALGIYDRLRTLKAPHQIRAAALRGAILTRGPKGLPLLKESLGSDEYVLFAAAVRTAQEMPGGEVTDVLTRAFGQKSTDRQLLVIQALGGRADEKALPALLAAAKLDLPAGQRVVLCGQARGLVKQPEQKQQLLAALGSIPSHDAILMAVPYLDEPATREAAGAAVVAVAEKLLQGAGAKKIAPQLVQPLERVAQSGAGAELTQRARTALERAQAKDAKK